CAPSSTLFPTRRSSDLLRFERADLLDVPRDQLPRAARVDDDQGAEARRELPGHRPPQLLAGPLVEGDDTRIRIAADQTNQPVAIDQRWAAEPPPRRPLLRPRVIVGQVVLLPQDLTGLAIQAEQIAGGAKKIHPVVV